MDQYKEVLDKLSNEVGYFYDKNINVNNLNSKSVVVEDCLELNGTYDNIEQLRNAAGRYYCDVSGGEIYGDSLGGEVTIRHYRYV